MLTLTSCNSTQEKRENRQKKKKYIKKKKNKKGRKKKKYRTLEFNQLKNNVITTSYSWEGVHIVLNKKGSVFLK